MGQVRRRHFLIASGSLFLPLPWTWVWAESEGVLRLVRSPKVALVLGNGAYKDAPPLRNPANDAKAMAETLKTAGFEVTTHLDAGRAAMLSAIQIYNEELARRKCVGVFYYAGHGLQLAWRNFLVPVDAKIGKLEDVQVGCVDLGGVIEGVGKAANPMNVIILDACRENPFGRDTRELQRGLSQMDAPPTTLLAYATAPGNVASDGEGTNGLYTETLLREIRVPEAKIEDVFKRVRLGVRRKTNGTQIPWESTSLEEDFYFIPPDKLKTAAQEQERREGEERARKEAQARREADERVRRQAAEKDIADAAARREAEAQVRREAEARAQREAEERAAQHAAAREKRESEERAKAAEPFRREKEDWDRIKGSRNAEDLYAFLQKYPSGFISEQAQFRLDQLDRPKIEAAPGENGIKPLEAGKRRFELGDEFVYDIIDRYTNIARRITAKVTYADDERAEFNNGASVYDQMGGILRNQSGNFSPSVVVAPAQISLGKRWRTAFTLTRRDGVLETTFWDFSVVALEAIQVPAGTFRAFKVEGRGEARYPGGMTWLQGTYWIDPQSMRMVRSDKEYRLRSGQMWEYSSTQLVSEKRAPR